MSDDLNKAIITVGTAAFIYFLRWPIIIAICSMFGWQFGYDNELWGIPAKLVELQNFRMVEPPGWNGVSVFPAPYVEGTLVNNSDKIVNHFSISISFYRCPINQSITDYTHQCMEVKSEHSLGIPKFYVSGLVIDPHRSRYFNIPNPNNMGNIFPIWFDTRKEWSNNEYVVYYSAKVSFVGD